MRTLLATVLLMSACGPTPGATPHTTDVIGGSALPVALPLDAAPPPAIVPPTPVVRGPTRYRITVVSATVDGKQADGAQWDNGGKASASAPSLDGPISRWRKEHPELDGTDAMIGEPLLLPGIMDDARKSPAPDPMVIVEAGGHVFKSPLLAGSFQPVWGFPVEVELLPDSNDVVHLTVVDWDGPSQYDVMGATVLEVKNLADSRVVNVPRFGNVDKLVLEVVPASSAKLEKRLAVPGKPTWTDTGLDVVAGEAVSIEAAGEVCTAGGDQAKCAGPEGQRALSDKSVAGLADRGHGALVGSLGDTRFFIGRQLDFVAPSSGRLYLGINDRDDGNNRGSFDARVKLQ